MTREELNKRRDEFAGSRSYETFCDSSYTAVMNAKAGFDAAADILLPETDRIRTLHRRECDYSCVLRVESESLRTQLAERDKDIEKLNNLYAKIVFRVADYESSLKYYTNLTINGHAMPEWLGDKAKQILAKHAPVAAMANSGQGDK